MNNLYPFPLRLCSKFRYPSFIHTSIQHKASYPSWGFAHYAILFVWSLEMLQQWLENLDKTFRTNPDNVIDWTF